ncbi:MAG: adenosylmethionine decarboxylase [Elusimicrobia bacterium]|nr:adenosylmethionine decarboxylase [Elusimicrobiota bacterium]
MRRVLARHHVIELEGCDARRSDDPARIGAALRRLCAEAALHVVRRVKHEFTPHGLTVLFVLRESHLAYSSWPERRYAVLDLFLCAATPGLAKAIARFARALGAGRVRARHFPCGPESASRAR